MVTQFGKQKWEEIKKKADIDVESFVSMNPDPDEITYNLVAAASEVLGLPPHKILETFGECWVTYTAREGYGEMLKLAADSFSEFVQNLDNLHARVGLSFPKLKPPGFHCTELTDKSLRLHYRSERDGWRRRHRGSGARRRIDTQRLLLPRADRQGRQIRQCI